MSEWKILVCDGLFGQTTNYIKMNDDGSCVVALPHDPKVMAWLEAGTTPEPWEATNGPV